MQVKKEEQSEKKEQQQSLNSRTSLLDYDRKTDQGIIAVKQKEYIKENKSSFDKLIEEVRRRKKKTLPTLPTNDSDNDSNDSFSILDNRDVDNNVLVKSEEDPFNTPGASSPANAISQMAITKSSPMKSLMTGLKFPESPAAQKIISKNSSKPGTNSTPKPSKGGAGGVSQLYVTPKRKSSDELSDDCKRFRQNSIASVISSQQQKKKKIEQLKKPSSLCPVCTKSVPENYINVHLDRCLRESEKDNKSSKTSSSATAPRASAKKTKPIKSKKKSSPKALFDDNSDDDFIDSNIEDIDTDDDEEEDERLDFSEEAAPRSQKQRKAKEWVKYKATASTVDDDKEDALIEAGIEKVSEPDDVGNTNADDDFKIDEYLDDLVDNVDVTVVQGPSSSKDTSEKENVLEQDKIFTMDSDDDFLMEKENEDLVDVPVQKTSVSKSEDDPKGKRNLNGKGGGKKSSSKKTSVTGGTSSSFKQRLPQVPKKSSRRLKEKVETMENKEKK